MAVDALTYGSVAGVERLVGDLVASRTFGASTVPTITQVELELDAVASDLNRELEASGYTVKVSSANNPVAYAFLTAANNYGAAARVLALLPVGAYNPEIEDMGTNRAEMYQRHLNHVLKTIRENRLKAGRLTERLAHLFCGGEETEDGEAKLPMFTRGMMDYPATRELTE